MEALVQMPQLHRCYRGEEGAKGCYTGPHSCEVRYSAPMGGNKARTSSRAPDLGVRPLYTRPSPPFAITVTLFPGGWRYLTEQCCPMRLECPRLPTPPPRR